MDTSLVMHVMCCFIHCDTTDTGCMKCKMNFDSLLISCRFHDRLWHGNGNRREEVNLQIYRAQLLPGGAAQMWPSGMDNRQSFLHLQPTLKWQAAWWKYEHAGIYWPLKEIQNFPCVTASRIKILLLLNIEIVPLFLLFLLGPAFNQFLGGAFLPRAPTL